MSPSTIFDGTILRMNLWFQENDNRIVLACLDPYPGSGVPRFQPLPSVGAERSARLTWSVSDFRREFVRQAEAGENAESPVIGRSVA